MDNNELSSKFEQYQHAQPHESSEPNSLWKAAYEHPGYVAAGAAVAAAGVAALIASRGYLARLSPFAARNVLLVEDGPFGAALEATIKEKGPSSMLSWLTGPRVTRVAGIKSLEPFTALTPEGSTIALNPAKFNVALVNGSSMPGGLAGPEIAAGLNRHHVTTIATSLGKDMNDAMVANGASVVAQKGAVLPALMDGRLNLRTAVFAPQRVQADILNLSKEIAQEGNPLREQANARIMEYFK